MEDEDLLYNKNKTYSNIHMSLLSLKCIKASKSYYNPLLYNKLDILNNQRIFCKVNSQILKHLNIFWALRKAICKYIHLISILLLGIYPHTLSTLWSVQYKISKIYDCILVELSFLQTNKLNNILLFHYKWFFRDY